jgi:DNA-binding winged helix-turn-helix (wHTH) protein/Tol biopolymer transport system component
VPRRILQFGDFELNCARFQLLRKGRPLRVERKPLELLILLASREGELVTRNEIAEKLWSNEVFVDTDHGINTAISKLRHLLRDDPESPRFIETVTGMGYRFGASVIEKTDLQTGNDDAPKETPELEPVEATEPVASTISPLPAEDAMPVASPAAAAPQSRAKLLGAVVCVVLVMIFAVGWYISRPLPPLRVASYTQITHGGGHKTPVGTDGTRLYFNRDSGDPIGEVNVRGGEPTTIHVPLSQYQLGEVFRDGSGLLIASNNGSEFELWKQQLPSGTMQRIAGHEQLKEFEGVALSPDGKSIAFITSKGEVIATAADGSNVRRLLSPPKDISEPYGGDITWSPDGMTLRFTWNHRFWEIRADGSNLHALTPGWRPGAWQCCGDWMDDGKSFVYVSSESLSELPEEFGELWALDESPRHFGSAEPQPVQLTSGPIHWSAPVAGREGDLFAKGTVLRGELVRFDSSSRELRTIWHGISAEFVEFSRDGDSVVYVNFPEGILWRAKSDGTSPIQLTSPPLYPLTPRWSPDGSRILFFTMGLGEPRRAYVVPAQGGNVTEISAANEPSDILDPTWSPDGKKIAYSIGDGRNSPHNEIEILDLASRQATKVPGSDGMWSPRWSPDGRYIAALDPTWSMVIFDFSTQKWTTVQKGACSFPTWSRDSRFIFFENQFAGYGVYRISVQGGKAERIVDLSNVSLTGALNNWFGLDPDGALLLLRDAGSDEIYSLTLRRK